MKRIGSRSSLSSRYTCKMSWSRSTWGSGLSQKVKKLISSIPKKYQTQIYFLVSWCFSQIYLTRHWWFFCLDIWGYYRLGYTKPAMQGKVNLRNPRFLKRAISVLFFSLFSSFQYRFTRWYVKFTDDWFEPWTNCKINLGYCPYKNPLNLQTMEWGQSWPLRTLFWCTTCAGMRPRGSLTSSPSGARSLTTATLRLVKWKPIQKTYK